MPLKGNLLQLQSGPAGFLSSRGRSWCFGLWCLPGQSPLAVGSATLLCSQSLCGEGFRGGEVGEFAETGFSSLMSVVADKAMVRKEPLWAVVKGDDYRVNNKHDGKLPRRTVDQIIQEAESLVGKTMPYSVTSKNCEHFVTKLRYGVARSDQVRDAMVAGAVGIVGVGALVAVATFIGTLLSDNKQEDE
ncbi:phospholipase A and acyltransferase 3-like isoform X1 [Lepidochelys kempii]|uniref:phospholipase A and acyltransferase 3-like isoform X1 n=1 Tax=Lepidochelys kempii TaxID=8472 RepID=UPI003C6FCB8E